MRILMCVALVSLTACAKAPPWADTCECAEGQLCRSDYESSDPGGAACIEVPTTCAAAFTDPCDTSAVDEACLTDACGAAVSSHSAECYDDGDALRFYLACEASL